MVVNSTLQNLGTKIGIIYERANFYWIKSSLKVKAMQLCGNQTKELP